MNRQVDRRHFLKCGIGATYFAAASSGGGVASDLTTGHGLRSHAADVKPTALDQKSVEAEVQRRARENLPQRRLVVDYYRIGRKLAYPLPVTSLSLPDVPVPAVRQRGRARIHHRAHRAQCPFDQRHCPDTEATPPTGPGRCWTERPPRGNRPDRLLSAFGAADHAGAACLALGQGLSRGGRPDGRQAAAAGHVPLARTPSLRLVGRGQMGPVDTQRGATPVHLPPSPTLRRQPAPPSRIARPAFSGMLCRKCRTGGLVGLPARRPTFRAARHPRRPTDPPPGPDICRMTRLQRVSAMNHS